MALLALTTMALAKLQAKATNLGASKTLAKQVKKYLMSQSRTEMTESTSGSEKDLAKATSDAHHQQVNNIDFTSNKITELVGLLLPGFVKEAAMGVLHVSSTQETLYALFKNLKNEFCNCWTPFAEFCSGDSEEDMRCCVYQIVWAE